MQARTIATTARMHKARNMSAGVRVHSGGRGRRRPCYYRARAAPPITSRGQGDCERAKFTATRPPTECRAARTPHCWRPREDGEGISNDLADVNITARRHIVDAAPPVRCAACITITRINLHRFNFHISYHGELLLN